MSFLSGIISGGLLMDTCYRFRSFCPELFRNEGQFITNGELYDYVQDKAKEMGITKQILVTYIPNINSTAKTLGMNVSSFLPEIVIGDASLLTQTLEENKITKGILTHELAHIKHNDNLKRLIPTVTGIAAAIFVNPLVGLVAYPLASMFIKRNAEKEADLESLNFLDDDTKQVLIENLKPTVEFERAIENKRFWTYMRWRPMAEERVQMIEDSLKKKV